MAKSTKKKPAKEASTTFHNIMAASVKGNPKPVKKNAAKNNNMGTKNEKQERYESLYTKVQEEMRKKKIVNRLLDVCSVSLDRNGNDNHVNLEFLLEPTTIDEKAELQKSFDKHSKVFGFTMNYINLSGNLY